MSLFIPVTLGAARALRSAGTAENLIGYADGPALRAWLGDAQVDDDQARYIALNHAGVAALTQDEPAPTRLVLALDRNATGPDPLGAVPVSGVAWADVRSLFADEEAAAAAVSRARTAARGLDLAAALADPLVTELEQTHDLLWYAPEELDAILAR